MKFQINASTTERVSKRAAVDELGDAKKKIMIEHRIQEKEISTIAPNSCDQSKFISASVMVNAIRNNIQPIPELTDEELLAMTLDFEKKHPQE